MSSSKKVPHVFIDEANIWQVYKAKGRLLDFENLKNYLKQELGSSSVEVFYFSAYPADDTREHSLDGKHKFYTYLKKALGFNVVKKKLKRIRVSTEDGEYVEEKGDMDVEITVNALHHIEKYKTAVFFTGDSDFLALVNYLQNSGKNVYIYSSENNISHELRTGGDGYTDILDIKADIWGDELKHREDKK